MKTGMKISRIDIQSRKNPQTKQITRNRPIVIQGAILAVAISCSVSATPPEATKTPENMLPPSRIIMIMLVTLSVLIRDSCSTAKLKVR